MYQPESFLELISWKDSGMRIKFFVILKFNGVTEVPTRRPDRVLINENNRTPLVKFSFKWTIPENKRNRKSILKISESCQRSEELENEGDCRSSLNWFPRIWKRDWCKIINYFYSYFFFLFKLRIECRIAKFHLDICSRVNTSECKSI